MLGCVRGRGPTLVSLTLFISGLCGVAACDSADATAEADPGALAADGASLGPSDLPCAAPLDCLSLATAGGCEVATCDVNSQSCVLLSAPDGTPCGASEATCGEDGTCQEGQCVASVVAGEGCDDANPCTVDVCAPGVGCSNLPIPDGSTCDDDRTCTSSDKCLNGVCQGTMSDPDCTEPECGDGSCDADEDDESCPEDCSGVEKSVCGDGECSEDERFETCAQDCAPTETTCGDGVCEGAEPFFCPQDCQ
ncbi:MAG: hypothetical protein CL940_09430 [Deltaproteobacteria bacterium]|nr:hypothetical protein [Deltaproteobacteria bacterium]